MVEAAESDYIGRRKTTIPAMDALRCLTAGQDLGIRRNGVFPGIGQQGGVVYGMHRILNRAARGIAIANPRCTASANPMKLVSRTASRIKPVGGQQPDESIIHPQ